MILVLDDAPTSDRAPLEWWAGSLVSGTRVQSWVPGGFERYAKVLHPAYAREEKPQGFVHRPVTWKELAEWSGQRLTAETCIEDLLVRPDGSSWDRVGTRPDAGRLDPHHVRRLVHLLASATEGEDVWFLVWAGYGSGVAYRGRTARIKDRRGTTPHDGAELEINDSWRGAGRTYLLFHGRIDPSVGDPSRPLERSPSFWWPTDRAWFVSTDIDSYSTYVGGSAELIERLLTDAVLEALPVGSLDDPYDPCASRPERG